MTFPEHVPDLDNLELDAKVSFESTSADQSELKTATKTDRLHDLKQQQSSNNASSGGTQSNNSKSNEGKQAINGFNFSQDFFFSSITALNTDLVDFRFIGD